MSEPEDKWQDLLRQLAAGDQVAWDTQDIANPTEQAVLEQLQHIHKIQQVFAANQAPKTADEEAASASLFCHAATRSATGCSPPEPKLCSAFIAFSVPRTS